MTNPVEGHGLEGRYGGLPDPFSNESFAKVAILPVPFDLTTSYQHGTDKGPEAIIEASRNMELYDIETHSQVYLKGIWTAPPVKEDSSEKMLSELEKRTAELIKKDKFVVTLGGEHSISFAPIKAHADHYGPLTVLQFDAHADLHPALDGNPLSHGSVMARVKELPNVEKVVSIGIRSMSHEELPLLESANTFFGHQLNGTDLIETIISRLSQNVYITFDLDAFDSSLMPSTGTPEPGGLFWNPTMKILKHVFEERNVIGCDIVELLPNPSNVAPDYLAAKLIYKLLSYRFIS